MKSLPSQVLAYPRTKEFSESTVPAGLTRQHDTKAGVWVSNRPPAFASTSSSCETPEHAKGARTPFVPSSSVSLLPDDYF